MDMWRIEQAWKVFLVLLGSWAGSLSGAVNEASADRLEMESGAVLLGSIERIESRIVRLWTDYAGVLEVDRGKLASVRSRQRFSWETEGGQRMEGILVMGEEDREWRLLSGAEEVKLGEAELLALSLASETAAEGVTAAGGDRSQVEETESAEPAAGPGDEAPKGETKPKFVLDSLLPPIPEDWSLEGGLNLTGKSGNSKSFDIELHLAAEWDRDFDRLNAYGRYSYGTSNEVRSSDEIVVGGRYTNFLFDPLGVFLRQELERDQFENIAVRSTTALGLSYRWINWEALNIEFRAGFSYRYEDYEDDGTDGFPGMDFGADVNWQISDWIRFKGTYTLLPTLDDEGDFIFEQDSGVNLPLSRSDRWKMRFGISSQYNNQPDGNRRRSDYRYYARVIASWN